MFFHESKSFCLSNGRLTPVISCFVRLVVASFSNILHQQITIITLYTAYPFDFPEK